MTDVGTLLTSYEESPRRRTLRLLLFLAFVVATVGVSLALPDERR
jgi:hypothetical protein